MGSRRQKKSRKRFLPVVFCTLLVINRWIYVWFSGKRYVWRAGADWRTGLQLWQGIGCWQDSCYKQPSWWHGGAGCIANLPCFPSGTHSHYFLSMTALYSASQCRRMDYLYICPKCPYFFKVDKEERDCNSVALFCWVRLVIPQLN